MHAAATAIIPLMLFAAPAIGAPMLSVTATDNGAPLTFVTGTNTPGNLTGTFLDANFSEIAVAITGIPDVPSPDLGTVTLQVSGSAGGGHTIDLVATQTGITQPPGFSGALTQTMNNLIGGGGPVTEDFSINGTIINSHTFAASPPRADTAMFLDPNLGAITSEAQEFVASFTAGAQDIEMTQEFVAAQVSEPTSLAILAAALGFFGWRRYRSRRRVAPLAA